jgi:hypothetical protein
MHKLAIFVGALIIGAAAHVSIAASGGYGALAAPLQLAVALGLIVGAICVGRAWRECRIVIVACLVVALAAGEGFAVIMTAERTIAARELAAAPLRDAETARAGAEARVKAAESAKTEADKAALTEAAKPGCRKECRTLIEGAKADAQRELEAARAALAALPPVRSASPLADRLGIAGWTLDLIAAALASISANGLGAALVAFGAHGIGHREKVRSTPTAQVAEVISPVPASTALEHAARFGLDALAPATAATPLANLHSAYQAWCRERGESPLPPREIALALKDLVSRSGLRIEAIDGAPHIVGAKLKIRPQRRALGHMTRSA